MKHNNNPPGSGKTLIARAMPGILPKLELSEALDIIRFEFVRSQSTKTR